MSLALKLVNGVLRRVVKPFLRRVRTPAQLRRAFHLATLPLWWPHGTRSRTTAHWTEFTRGILPPGQALLYLHGGGYVAGSPFTHREMLGRLARLSGLRVVAPDYRLAPEHPLPAAMEDALAAWDRLLAEGLTPDRIALAGDSAGGGLALALLAVLCGRGTPPGAAVAFSPWTDLTGSGASVRENAAVDPIFPGERLPELIAFTLGKVPPEDPRISPLFADFPGAPPVLIQVGSTEILRDDSLRMAARLRDFGAQVDLQVIPRAPHVFQMFSILPEARAAMAHAGAFLRRTLSSSSPPDDS